MQHRSDAKTVNPGQCARSNLLCAGRASCRQSRSAWSRRACRRHRKLSQKPAIIVSESDAAVKCSESVAPTVLLGSDADATVELPEERHEVQLEADQGDNISDLSATGVAKELDLDAVEGIDWECDSITDSNSTDIAKDQFVKQFVASLQEKRVSGNRPSSFQSVSLPKVSLSSYASRIYKYFHCTDECFLLCLVYIDRIVNSQPDIEVTDFTSHRLFFISAVVAAKFHDDAYASNDYFARVGGIHPTELNALEAEFLQLLDWRLYVGPAEYDLYLQNIRGIGVRSATCSSNLFDEETSGGV